LWRGGTLSKVDVNGISIGYGVDGHGEPLILLMGVSGGRKHWFFQARAFKKHYRIITIDNRGVGDSDKPTESYDIKTMADDTIGVMNHLGIDKAHILGTSLGGLIAQEIAINYPERVKKLILGSTNPGGSEMEEANREMQIVLGLGEGFSREDLGSIDVVKFMHNIVGLSFNKRLFRMIFVQLSGIYAKSIGVEGIMGQLGAPIGHDTLDRLHMIEAPTLVITGTGDRVIPPRCSDMIASRMTNARLVKIEGGSHAVHMEMSRRFNKEVLNFLRDC
jgi:pimeloyl-ACP methyl ester carboxylesterase